MKTIVMRKRGRDNLLHIETPLGIVNVTIGLHDIRGREVVSVEVKPDTFAGEKKVVRSGYCNTRLIRLKTVEARHG